MKITVLLKSLFLTDTTPLMYPVNHGKFGLNLDKKDTGRVLKGKLYLVIIMYTHIAIDRNYQVITLFSPW